MRRMIPGGLLAALLILASSGCGTGPAPRPVDSSEQRSAEATARAAAERTRAGQEGLIYASSKHSDQAQAEAAQTRQHLQDSAATSELRLTFDEDGRLLIDDRPLDRSVGAAGDAEAVAPPDAASPPEPASEIDALVAALSEVIDALEPTARLRILITPPPTPQRFDALFAAIGRVVAGATVPVEVHVTPAP